MKQKNWQTISLLFSIASFLMLGCSTTEGDSPRTNDSALSSKAETQVNSKSREIGYYQFLEEAAYKSNINFAHLKINKPRVDKNAREGYMDRRTELSTAGKRGSRRFLQQEITRFIKLLNGSGDNKKVTAVTISHPSEDRKMWDLALEVTERLPLAEGGGRSSVIPPLPSVASSWYAIFNAIEKTRGTDCPVKIDRLKIDMRIKSPSVTMSGEVESGDALDKLISNLEENSLFTSVDYPTFSPKGNSETFFSFQNMKLTVDLAAENETD